jgi:acyl-CoA synthetase (AMP-forming)/AMP-acid ligase II
VVGTVPGTTPYDWAGAHARLRPGEAAVLAWRDSDVRQRLSWEQLTWHADQARAGLACRGVGVGDRVIVALANDASFVIALLACAAAGAIAVPAPVPAMRRTDAFRERLTGIARVCEPSLVITAKEWIAPVSAVVSTAAPGCQLADYDDLHAAENSPPAWPAPACSSDIALLQFTSGSTASPRGVTVTYGMLAASCGQAAAVYQEQRADTAVTWVPLYHDMGLVTGVMRPLYSGYPTVILQPGDFVRSPGTWLEAIDRCGGTLSSAPDFGYELCVRKVPAENADRLDLSGWRVARNAGEVVRQRTLDRFCAHFARSGFRPESLCPSYGLAEATLTVTTCTSSVSALRLAVRREGLRAGTVTAAASATGEGDYLVSSGVPLPGTSVRISGSTQDGHVGEVLIRGPQIFPGYWPAHRRPASSGREDGDWHATGDVGFLWRGHLFVLGRADDTLVIHGRNYFAADIALACTDVPGIRPGRVAALADGQDEGRRIRLLAELTTDADRSAAGLAGIARAAQLALAGKLELYVSEVALVEPGQLPITTSGKVRVSEAGRRHAAGVIAPLAAGPPPGI